VRSTEAGAFEAAVRPDREGGYLLGDVRAWLDGDVLRVAGEEATRAVDVYRAGDAVWLVDAGVPSRWGWATETAGHQLAAGSLEAPMPGVVLEVRTAAGAAVAEGDVLLVLESMKMELSIVSPSDGVVGDVYVREGDRVAKGAALVSVGAAE
jgi:biotin carboxyl carrier protein